MNMDTDSAAFLGSYFLQITDTFFCTIQQGKIAHINDAALSLLGLKQEDIIGKDASTIIAPAFKSFFEEKVNNLKERTDYFPIQINTKSNSIIDMDMRLVPIMMNDSKICIVEGRDKRNLQVLERKVNSLTDRIAHLSPIDVETHLPSHILFTDRTEQAILRALREARGKLENIHLFLTVIVMNIEGLKQVEEKFGAAGKAYALDILVTRFKATIRTVDTIAKPLDDSFYFLFEGILDKKNIQIILDRLKNCAHVPIAYQNETLPLKMSLGMSIYPDNGTTAVSLLKYARLNILPD